MSFWPPLPSDATSEIPVQIQRSIMLFKGTFQAKQNRKHAGFIKIYFTLLK